MEIVVTVPKAEGVATITVTGEVDVSNAAELRAALDEALEGTSTAVEVDIAEVSYIDSTGIGVFVGAAHRAQDAGKRLAVVHPQRNVARVLGLLGLQDELGVVE